MLDYCRVNMDWINVKVALREEGKLMNGVFYECLDEFIIIFINDILEFSKSLEEYKGYLRVVMEKLREYNLFVKLRYIFD